MGAPLLLRLRPEQPLTEHGIARALGRGMRWSEARALAGRFALSSRERDFARTVLRRRLNLWLWRCRQGAAAGDFAVVDLAEADPGRRRVHVLELKADAPLREGGADHQLRNAGEVLVELSAEGVLATGAELLLLRGDRAALLEHLGCA